MQPLLHHRFAGDHDVMSFVKQCRRDQNERNRARAKQTAEALQAAQFDPPFTPLGEDMPEMLRRSDETT